MTPPSSDHPFSPQQPPQISSLFSVRQGKVPKTHDFETTKARSALLTNESREDKLTPRLSSLDGLNLRQRKKEEEEVIGIIRRKAMIRDLAAVYHAECLAYCQELLQLQKKWEEETCIDVKAHEDLVKDNMRPNKRSKKAR
ncbi:hypothetical protein Dimus_030982 [Dionaea muscipula]